MSDLEKTYEHLSIAKICCMVNNLGEHCAYIQMHQRQTLGRLTLQGNFYPMTSMMYIEDDLFRVTLVTAQSHGAAALQPGTKLNVTHATKEYLKNYVSVSQITTDQWLS